MFAAESYFSLYFFQEMYKYQHILDMRQLYTNNIHAIATSYGIEAANKAIVKVRVFLSAYYSIHKCWS